MTEESDAKLLIKAQKGDTGSFGILFEKYYQKAFRVSCRILNNSAIAEDIVMDSFIDMYKSEVNSDINFSSYFMRVVVNNSLNELKRNMKIACEYSDEIVAEREPDPLVTVSEREFSQKIMNYLDTLPVTQKTAFVLVKEMGYSYREVASIMNTTEKSVEALLFRARKKLQSFIKNQEDINI